MPNHRFDMPSFPIPTPASSSLERLIPDQLMAGEITGLTTLALHLERYTFAAQHAKPGRILDIACGVGYGTRMLFDEIPHPCQVFGVDCSPDSIEYARQRYAREGITFLVADAMTYHDPEPFDTIVSLETIEHLAHPTAFISQITSLLRPGGILIASAPTSVTTDANPHHLHDFTESTFRELIERHGLSATACLRQIQPFNPWHVLRRKEQRLQDLRRNLGWYYLTHPRSLLNRIRSTLRFGFTNRYMTVAWRKDETRPLRDRCSDRNDCRS